MLIVLRCSLLLLALSAAAAACEIISGVASAPPAATLLSHAPAHNSHDYTQTHTRPSTALPIMSLLARTLAPARSALRRHAIAATSAAQRPIRPLAAAQQPTRWISTQDRDRDNNSGIRFDPVTGKRIYDSPYDVVSRTMRMQRDSVV